MLNRAGHLREGAVAQRSEVHQRAKVPRLGSGKEEVEAGGRKRGFDKQEAVSGRVGGGDHDNVQISIARGVFAAEHMADKTQCTLPVHTGERTVCKAFVFALSACTEWVAFQKKRSFKSIDV